jgi:hypothetical protein
MIIGNIVIQEFLNCHISFIYKYMLKLILQLSKTKLNYFVTEFLDI